MKRLVTLVVLTVVTLPIAAERRRGVRPPEAPTFSNEVVRIFQGNCQSCHHDGGIGPFSLMTYEDAAPWADSIEFMTRTKQMPPWRPADGCGEFEGVRRLTDQQIRTLDRWVNEGAPEGDRSQLPEPLVFENGWPIGQPDAVMVNEEPFLPSVDTDTYRCFSIPYALGEQKWIRSVDVRPGDPETVHHVIAYLDRFGASKSLDENEAGPGYTCFGGPGIAIPEILGAWAPGNTPTILPDGVGVELPENARVILQVHYSPHFEQPLPDKTEVGFYFARGPVDSRLTYAFVINDDFRIPAGATGHEVVATMNVPLFASPTLYSVYPHMHLLGKSIKVEILNVGNTSECLIDLPEWDFHWQQNYALVNPLKLGGGSTVRVRCIFDNSSGNDDNPNNPPKDVTYGEKSTDEMCLALIGFTQ